MIPNPIMPTAFESMTLLPICCNGVKVTDNSSRMPCCSKKLERFSQERDEQARRAGISGRDNL
jgi:hypothetical protein